MQEVTFIDGFRQYDPDYGDLAWPSFNGGLLFPLADDSDGYYADESVEGASVAVELVDDSRIPPTAKIDHLSVVYRIGNDALVKEGPLQVHPYLRYAGGGPTFQPGIAYTYAVGFTDFVATFFADPQGSPWTRRSIFYKNGQALRLGLRADRPIPGQTGDVKWTRVQVKVSFLLLDPIATTLGATMIGGVTAQLNGSIDPQGTNSSFPYSYYFEWGLTDEYGNTTSPVGGIFGSSVIQVSAALSGLAQGVTYNFRLVVTTPEGTFYGMNLTFVTDASISLGRWRLDEFKRVATGTFTASDRTRETSEGFDRSAGNSEAAGCPDLTTE